MDESSILDAPSIHTTQSKLTIRCNLNLPWQTVNAVGYERKWFVCVCMLACKNFKRICLPLSKLYSWILMSPRSEVLRLEQCWSGRLPWFSIDTADAYWCKWCWRTYWYAEKRFDNTSNRRVFDLLRSKLGLYFFRVVPILEPPSTSARKAWLPRLPWPNPQVIHGDSWFYKHFPYFLATNLGPKSTKVTKVTCAHIPKRSVEESIEKDCCWKTMWCVFCWVWSSNHACGSHKIPRYPKVSQETFFPGLHSYHQEADASEQSSGWRNECVVVLVLDNFGRCMSCLHFLGLHVGLQTSNDFRND